MGKGGSETAWNERSAVVSDAVAQKRALRAQQRYLKSAGPVDEQALRRAMDELG